MELNPTDFESGNAASHFAKSLHETGFGVLKNHPIDQALFDQVDKDWLEFFNSDTKYNYAFDKITFDGFVPADQSETAKGYDVPDLKEFYQLYPHGRYPIEISDATKILHQQMIQLTSTLLTWLQSNLPEDIQNNLSMPLPKMIENTTRNQLRINHYPPITGNEKPGAVRSAAHEDIDLLTLLPVAEQPGLQIKPKGAQDWIPVNAERNNLVINAGDMLQLCTNYYYKSTSHRVVNLQGDAAKHSRISTPLFMHPRDDVKLSEHHTGLSYLHERLIELGLLKKEDIA